MSQTKFHVKRGDTVQVISGNHKGSIGKVLEIRSIKSQVVIEGVRMIKKHQRKSQDQPNGAIVELEGPIHISNVKITEKAAAGKKKAA
ncbi:MAG: 50S ribosomal protein L24 [Terrimicrobiaceae bacterium]|nr:50S ribosomal protein L24 [Terrimicrobiaceae bacterium]